MTSSFGYLARDESPPRGWRLFIRGAGYLKYFEGGVLRFEMVLKARYVRLLRLLTDARRLDAASQSGTGGWRTRQEIGDLMGQLTEWSLPPDSVSSYFCAIKRELARQWTRAGLSGTPPQLLESAHGQGWRIPPQVSLEIDDLAN